MDAGTILIIVSAIAGAACLEMWRRQRRWQAALAATLAQLREAQRLEAMGRLAGGISHDFNNLLTAMLGFTELVLADESLSNAAREDIEQVRRSAASAASLTRQLLAFSRKQVLDPVVLDLNSVVTEFSAMLRRVLGEDVTLRTTLAAEPACVVADRAQLEQVLMNLAANARDAMSGGGRLDIVVGVDDAHATLAVTDTGCGIPAALLPRIFEPFFTTKDAGAGTGLGLATVHGIVTHSGGTLEVESREGRGTCFRIALPRTAGPMPADGAAADGEYPRGNETVLVVEDEPAVCRLIRSALERNGYRVLVAENGVRALELIQRNAIDLVLSDVILPEMSGTDIASRVEALRPCVPVMLMSGYSAQTCRRLRNVPENVTFLQKPFTPARLAAAVRQNLDGSRAALATA